LTRDRAALLVTGILSLVLVTFVNRATALIAPRVSWLPDTCIASSLACLLIYILIRPARPFALPARSTEWPPYVRFRE